MAEPPGSCRGVHHCAEGCSYRTRHHVSEGGPDTAPLPVEILRADAPRCPALAEAAAYFTVTEAVADAADRGAGRATVTVIHEDGRLVVTVEDDGAVRAASLAALSDRVGALGGSLLIRPALCRAEIPCVSS